ncbi:helix-turn-helix domain-containing protein [Enterococcus innesii]|uniref:helix-turn-helix domain-containing protein n=1 Tax=Enterococcus TaxID=1350 RepID=UPI003985616B
MDDLFDHLLLNAKTKRWLILLEILEETEEVTAPALVKETQIGRRTIMKDIQALKAYFGETIQLIGDEKGYHFSFIDPSAYYVLKQSLLAEEKLFFFIDQVAKGKHWDNEQWREYLAIPAGSFHPIKHHFQSLLANNYGCQLTTKYNQLTGEEASIRQFLYDFYFTLPLYPPSFSKQMDQLQKEAIEIHSVSWQLDQTLLNQWLKIAHMRISQDYLLPETETHEQDLLVHALDQQVSLSLPDREKATLFLLALNESQFLDPEVQKAFIQTFSSEEGGGIHDLSSDQLSYQLFETLLCLMKRYFQLPQMEGDQKKEETVDKQVVLDALVQRFKKEQERYRKLVYVTYHLEGPAALKRWIKKEVSRSFQASGMQVVDTSMGTPIDRGRHILVTNRSLEKTSKATVSLPKVPNTVTLVNALTDFF